MFGKTSLFKILFVMAVLGVLTLAAVVPGVARAFFQNEGVSGFSSRLLSDQVMADSVRLPRLLAPFVGKEPTQTGEIPGGSVVGSIITAAGDNSQDQAGFYFELVGTLDAVDGDMWTVDGFTVVVTPETTIKGTFVPGDQVKVEGTLQDDGSILASEIKAPGDTSTSNGTGSEESGNSPVLTAAHVEVTDVLNANTGDTWMVGSWSVVLSTDTERKGDLAIGALVTVEGTLQADGSVLASEIKVISTDGTKTPGEVELMGILEGQNGMIWTVSGITVELTDGTAIYGSPVDGDPVKVKGMTQADGSILASEIKSAIDESDDGSDDPSENHNTQNGTKVEFSGELTAMNGNEWIVNGMTVIVTDMTELKGTLEIGAMVSVEGYQLENGSVEAYKIKVSWQNGSGTDDDHESYSGSNSYSDSEDEHSSRSGSYDNEHDGEHDGSHDGTYDGGHDHSSGGGDHGDD